MAINDVFPVGVKREIITALRPLFGNDFPIEALRNKIYVGLDYPDRDVKYPAIFVTFNSGVIENVGIGHYDIFLDENGTPRQYRHFRFTGTVTFTILALSQQDRDQLAAALVQILAMGEVIPAFESFHWELRDNDYIMLQLMTDQITPGQEQAGTVPWGDDEEIVFSSTYSVEAYGEFYSDTETGDLIQISEVDVWPYRSDESAPW